MQPRINASKAAPDVYAAMLALDDRVNKLGLDRKLVDLARLRVSQINGCAFCIDMHVKDLRAEGMSEESVYMLDAWRDAPLYSHKERAALAWGEALTRLRDRDVPQAVFEEARAQFSETELVKLSLAVVEINGWNRFNIAFKTVPGTYGPPSTAERAS